MTVFKIETIKIDKDNEVSFCPLHGGITTSIKIKGKEILYFDKETFDSGESSVRGGVPILFPNAGELIENNLYPNLRRHGFARDLEWYSLIKADGFIETLSSNQFTKNVYPYNFKLSVLGLFEKDNSFSLIQEVENLEKEKEIPISMGFHPYFKVRDEDKKNIKFKFLGGVEIEEKFDIWANGGTVVVNNPKVKDSSSSIIIFIPSLGELLLDLSIEYEKIWIWSLPGSDFICIEPSMRNENGLIDRPYMVPVGEILKTRFNIKII